MYTRICKFEFPACVLASVRRADALPPASVRWLAAVGAAQKHFADDALGSHRGSATVMPITTLEAELVARSLRLGWAGEGARVCV